ncbi:hypothetical protein JOQ06_014474 [Pogonophryne albipinna]|uniref:Ras association domain-containing protein 5 n=1 Tax=Pogonophryne albipinna TaxID=1090488 RepID=A0AAD6FAH1_9TELE|nr:hypothetical protein JOQ06_014474 [Pogonophryne albipinna]
MVINKLVAMVTMLNVRDAVVSLSQQDTDRDANISRQKNNRADLSSLTAAMERRTRKQYCSYTCHLECESRVQLDCNRKDREEETPSPRRRCSSAAPQYRIVTRKAAIFPMRPLLPPVAAALTYAKQELRCFQRHKRAGCGIACMPLLASVCWYDRGFQAGPKLSWMHQQRSTDFFWMCRGQLEADQKGLPQAVNVLYRCRGPSLDLSMTVNAVLTPSMTSSNSMSSGYCSLDDESEDFSFFTAKTSFFRKPNHAPKQKEAKEEETRETKDLSEEEVSKRIEEYNAQVSENGMNLASDGSYTGFIKVNLRLSRPVTVPAVEAGDSEGASRQAGGRTQPSEDQDVSDCGQSEKRTSFYLPSDCVKQIHIRSLTTVSEVIQGLLKKFMVLDNPRKFALYRQTHRDGQDLLQKLPLCERPLLLRLITGPDPEQLSFVLKENETGEVEWYAFSVPELQNFLVILGNEEAERARAVEQKYTAYRQKLQRALQQHDP